MPDVFLVFIPTDPRYVPSETARTRARALLEEHFPDASEVCESVTDGVTFRDCGAENFSSVSCPSCGEKLDHSSWIERMDEDYSVTEKHFALEPFRLPCCGVERSLNELVYDRPQGFARFGLEVMNPRGDAPSDAWMRRLDEVLSAEMRSFWRLI